MTVAGLLVGAALALALLAHDMLLTLRPCARGGRAHRIVAAATWMLAGAFTTFTVARISDYLG